MAGAASSTYQSGYLDLLKTANNAGASLQALALVAGRVGAPSPVDLGLSTEVDWPALLVAARVVMTWSTTVAELLAEGRPIQAPTVDGA